MKHVIKIEYDDKTGIASMEFNHKQLKKSTLLAVLHSAPIVLSPDGTVLTKEKLIILQ